MRIKAKVTRKNGQYKKFEKALRSAMYDMAIEIMKEGMTVAKDNAPEDTGTLKRSISVTLNELPSPESAYQRAQNGENLINSFNTKYNVNNEKIQVFGSANTPYATTVHELHNTHSKFLEKGMKKVKREVKMFEKKLKRVLKSLK